MSEKYLGVSTVSETEFDPQTGFILQKSAIQNVAQSIIRALSISNDVLFGRQKLNHLEQLQFLPRDQVTVSLLHTYIKEIITKEVKTVKNLFLQFELPEDNPALINCSINFQVKQSNAPGSLIFPFYLNL